MKLWLTAEEQREILSAIRAARRRPFACRVEGCESPADDARGMCVMHYRRWLRHRDVHHEPDYQAKCRVPGCNRRHRAGGLCKPHYYQAWRKRQKR